jgi:hypothetical protein
VDRLPDLNHPGLAIDTTLGYQRQEMLALRDAGVEDVIGRFQCAEYSSDKAEKRVNAS